ncbi:hypothetical protein [Gimesia panareensis]|uniref:Uncharacterized protein n=1 Tax=Gimesia panareensis TaxID=2527978 RepID=A0A518A4A3_9PLAN|nr:hypothetical protein [Gimesia panareensis]QDT27647.1 hypothetical protein Enr10x_29650 [Gimesia panareensis]QDU49538.1 hypothetical protein Pan110_18760 [Gimesia panareensis]
MRIMLLLCWGLVPFFLGAYHYGPGQAQLKLDDVDRRVKAAQTAEEQGNWNQAVALYNEALPMVPSDNVKEAQKLRLERDKAMMFNGQLPDAYLDLQALLDELQAEEKPDQELLKQTRSAMANAEYYVTWTLRLEGVGKEGWEPIIESSRQNYRLLAENAAKADNKSELKEQQENLEAVIRLANLDLTDLQGIPIPKQCKCKGCCNGVCNGKKKGKKKGKGQKKAKDNRGASASPPPDKSGS